MRKSWKLLLQFLQPEKKMLNTLKTNYFSWTYQRSEVTQQTPTLKFRNMRKCGVTVYISFSQEEAIGAMNAGNS